MLNYAAVARYRLDRVEAWSNSARVAADIPLIKDVVQHTMATLRDVCPESRVAAHSVSITIHGSLAGQGQVAARIASYVTRKPEGPPLLTPTGVSFLCEFPSGEGQGSIILERSAVVPDGASLRVTSEHPGSLPEVDAFQYPRLTIQLANRADADQAGELDAYLDSGAARTLFNGSLAPSLGLDLLSGEEFTFQSTAGASLTARLHPVRLSHASLGSFDLEVGFSTGHIARNLLGRDFFSLLQIGSREHHSTLYVTTEP